MEGMHATVGLCVIVPPLEHPGPEAVSGVSCRMYA